jgi:3-deoxy-D-manno-octulosonic-acid transferase
VVPRHPQRFEEVADVLQAHGFKVLRRSRMTFDEADLVRCAQANTVVLGDTLGEMAFYYGVAQVALMGGSFERFGGQNLIEALACGCPVVLGPHTYNFEQASAQALEVGAALGATDMGQGVQKALELCRAPDWRLAMSQHGLNMLKGHQGVATRMAKQVLARLDRLTSAAR